MGWNNAQRNTSWEQEHGEGDIGVFTAVSLQEGAYKGAWQGGNWNCSTSRTAGDHMGDERDGTVGSTQYRAHTINVSSMSGTSEGWLVSRIITRQIITTKISTLSQIKIFQNDYIKCLREEVSLSSVPASLSFLISKANPTKQVLIYIKDPDVKKQIWWHLPLLCKVSGTTVFSSEGKVGFAVLPTASSCLELSF